MLTDCQKKENLQLMQEIEELRMWMYKKGSTLLNLQNSLQIQIDFKI